MTRRTTVTRTRRALLSRNRNFPKVRIKRKLLARRKEATRVLPPVPRLDQETTPIRMENIVSTASSRITLKRIVSKETKGTRNRAKTNKTCLLAQSVCNQHH